MAKRVEVKGIEQKTLIQKTKTNCLTTSLSLQGRMRASRGNLLRIVVKTNRLPRRQKKPPRNDEKTRNNK